MYYCAMEINNDVNCFIRVYKVDNRAKTSNYFDIDNLFDALLERVFRHSISKYQLSKLNKGRTIIINKNNPICKYIS